MVDKDIFAVAPDDLGRLAGKEAVDFVAGLLWADATRGGIPISKINISSRVEVADGGIDARVDAGAGGGDFIQPGHTEYQIKSGAFSPWQPAEIRKELFGDKQPSKAALGQAVRDCMDAGGAYVLVCTGVDLTVPQHQKAQELLEQNFKDVGYADPRVDVSSQNQLIGTLRSFPSLSLHVNGRGDLRFQTLKIWSEQDQMRTSLKTAQPQQDFIDGMREGLRSAKADAVHVHVEGEAGVGKTRLVLEALTADDLIPFVIYCDGPHQILETSLLNEILKDDINLSVVLVVDECDSSARADLWNKLKHHGRRIRFISIYNEFEKIGGNTAILEAPALDDERVGQILLEYIPADERADRWAKFCSGSPRVAHVIGGNLRDHPDDLLKSPDTVDVWKKYVAGVDDPDSKAVQERRLALRHIALFKRFGWSGGLIDEARRIATMVEQNGGIPWARFAEIVSDLRARKILQGENTLYITPQLLHIKLWTEWWDTYGVGFDLAAFSASMSDQLLEWFFEMFRYAAESDIAHGTVKKLLDEGGPFYGTDLLKDPRGARFFNALAEASPKAALRLLKKTVGTWTQDELLTFEGDGRRQVVWALEKIAVWRELFVEAARLILRLAEAENERWSNNATGVFAGLFSPGQGPVAPTEASPEERFPVLRQALESTSSAQRGIALKACDSSLQTGMFSRMAGAEAQGLRQQPKLWSPKTWGELFDAYRRPWNLLRERVDYLPEPQKAQAVDILLGAARGISNLANLAPMVIDTIDELLTKPYADRKKIIQLIEDVLHYDAGDWEPERRSAWERLRSALVTDDYHSQMERYVAMELLEDSIDKDGNQIDVVGPKLIALVEQSISDPSKLRNELPWLVTDVAKNGYRFGYELGKRDTGFSLISELLDAVKAIGDQVTAYFIGGYFRALFETDQSTWEHHLDDLAKDHVLKRLVPSVTWRSGITDRAAIRILRLAKAGDVGAEAFRMFAYGRVMQGISKDVLDEWIEFLLALDDREAASIGVDLYHFYYFRSDSVATPSMELTLSLLLAKPFFTPSSQRSRQRDDYDWTEVALGFVKRYPEQSVPLADKMIDHFGDEGTPLGGFRPHATKVLEEIARLFPEVVWNRIVRHLGPPIDKRAFRIKNWLREGGVSLFPADLVWRWIEEDVEKRAWYAASLVQPVFPGNPERLSARELLVRFGFRKDVQSNLWANFSTEVWTGPESAHYAGKLKWLRELRQGEMNQNVLDWIDEYSVTLEKQLEDARIREEREN